MIIYGVQDCDDDALPTLSIYKVEVIKKKEMPKRCTYNLRV